MKKILGYSLAVLLAIGAGLYVAFFFNPQTPEQEEINAVWVRFGEDIAALNEVVQSAPFNRDEQTAAEGYRHVARFLATFLAYHTDLSDPDYPQFMRFPNAVARVGWDNPDNPYLSFPVRGDHRYRLRGNVNAFDLVTINVYSGLLGHTPISEIRHVSGIASEDLIVDENGDFVLTLSAEPVEGNWIALEPDAYIVLIRRLVSDWEQTDEGLWEVVNLTTLGQGAPRPSPNSIARQLEDAAAHRSGNLRELLTLAHRITFQLTLSPNEISEPAETDPNIPMADPFQAASRGWFSLAEDEALLIEAPVAACRLHQHPARQSVDGVTGLRQPPVEPESRDRPCRCGRPRALRDQPAGPGRTDSSRVTGWTPRASSKAPSWRDGLTATSIRPAFRPG